MTNKDLTPPDKSTTEDFSVVQKEVKKLTQKKPATKKKKDQ